MEVSAVAAMNCALLLQQQLAQPAAADQNSDQPQSADSTLNSSSAEAGIAVS
jgi:hypothetical protein